MTNTEVASDPKEQLGQHPRPIVRLPRQGISGAAIAFGSISLALILFVVLNAQRQQRIAAPFAAQADGFVSPPPLNMPPPTEPFMLVPPARVVTAPVPSLSYAKERPLRPPRVFAPSIVPEDPGPIISSLAPSASGSIPDKSPARAIVFDLNTQPPAASGSAQPPASSGGVRTGAGGFDDAPATATTIASRTDIVPIGTLIAIALETAIDTTRPGLVRAVASRDTRGFDGRRVLIPRGSRFIGEYQADVHSGQNRVLVTWTRVIRPDGVTIRLGSPATDQLGSSGVPGQVNSFFFQRFAGAVLQSALTVGVGLASRPRAGSVIVGVPAGSITTLGQGLLPADFTPKITVKQGAALNVFVARDLDFSSLTVE